ncbi:MAG: hypothetical protein ACI90V_004441 [Bacillariaceae sp.]|jgi:hypothetical protein
MRRARTDENQAEISTGMNEEFFVGHIIWSSPTQARIDASATIYCIPLNRLIQFYKLVVSVSVSSFLLCVLLYSFNIIIYYYFLIVTHE